MTEGPTYFGRECNDCCTRTLAAYALVAHSAPHFFPARLDKKSVCTRRQPRWCRQASLWEGRRWVGPSSRFCPGRQASSCWTYIFLLPFSRSGESRRHGHVTEEHVNYRHRLHQDRHERRDLHDEGRAEIHAVRFPMFIAVHGIGWQHLRQRVSTTGSLFQ